LLTAIACFAILMAALVPAASRALQGVPHAGWAEVCTAFGTEFVRADDGAGDAPGGNAPNGHLGLHCPWCSSHVTTLGMPPVASALPALVPFATDPPELFLNAPHTLFAWTAAQPRGPPRTA
jgi:hypothetical protein